MNLNNKYYGDIKCFPLQFDLALEIVENIDLSKLKNLSKKAYLIGMGGSTLYGDWIKQLYPELDLIIHSGYGIPLSAKSNDLYFVASHSGNTEETISAIEMLVQKLYNNIIVFTSGGKLRQIAEENKILVMKLPTGIQPRLTTGYFLGYITHALNQLGFIKQDIKELSTSFKKLTSYFKESEFIEISKKLINKTPIIYADQTNWALAKIAKIKFNENSKIQSFWNYFPELNHNEMVGFTKETSSPYFIIFKSKFADSRNIKRMQVFTKLMTELNYEVSIIELKGDTFFEETIYAYYVADHLSYHLACKYKIDPEPVYMVEKFKQILLSK